MLLALDLGASTGWALESGPCGAMAFHLTSKGEARKDERAGRLQLWLSDLLTEAEVTQVLFEDVGHGGRLGSNGDLPPVIRATCWLRGIPAMKVDAKTWQAWAKRAGVWDAEMKSDVNDAKSILAWGLSNRGIFERYGEPRCRTTRKKRAKTS